MERTFYLDNLRSIMILIIIIFHSALSYTTVLPWWFALDKDNHQIIDLFIIFLDSFQLPILFFLSGYFALASLKKYESLNFTVKKIRKLAIPLILLSIIYTPVMSYIRYTLRTENMMGYLSYLKKYLSTFDFGIVYYTDTETIMKYADTFQLFHLWFVSVLFVFFCVTAVIYNLIIKDNINDNQVIKPYTPAFLAGGIIIAFSIFSTHMFFFDWEWIKVSSLFMCQPLRMPVYIGMFILGIYGYRFNWFKNQIPGKPWKWFILSLILFSFLLVCTNIMWIDQEKNNLIVPLLIGFFRSFMTISWLCFFLNFSKKYLIKTNRISRFISNHSYEIFLLHLPITVSLQLFFLNINLPLLIKFILVSALSIFLSLILSAIIYKRIQGFFENFSFFDSSKDAVVDY